VGAGPVSALTRERPTMRVLVLTSSWPLRPGDWRGGFVREWCLALQDQGMSLRVLVPRPTQEPEEDDRLPVDYLPRNLPASTEVFHGQGLEVELRRRPARVLDLPGALAAFALEALPRCLGADALVAHWVWPMGLVGAALSRMTGRPLGIVAHSGPPAPARLPGLSSLWRHTLGEARSVACVSDAVRSSLGGREMSGRVTIPLGVPVGPVAEPPGGSRFRVLFVGRMISLKGGDLLIRAVHGWPGTALTMIGDGPEASRWRALAHSLGVEARFLGERAPGEVLAEMSGADVLAVPSRRGPGGRVEGMPRVILEAWSRGLPVVVTAAGGAGEAVERWGAGLVVPPGDAGALREALGRLARAAGERERLREQAWRAAWEHRWEVIGPRWAEWVRGLAGPSGLC